MVPYKGRENTDGIYGVGSLIKFHTTREGRRGGRAPSRELRLIGYQGTEIVDLLRSWILYVLARDEIELYRDLGKFRKKYM